MSQASDPPEKSNSFEEWIHPPLRNCWFLTGPTCSGKTSVALEVAQRLDAEIVSLDSMAIYQGMDIGTAKPDHEQQAQVRHHMIDIVSPVESFSVSSYALAAHQVAREIWSRGKRVLFCGGTPLYLKSLVRGLFLGPEADWEFRNAVEKDIEEFGEDALRERLMQVDPLLGHKLHPHDHRRMIRALEVARMTGKPLSHWQQQFDIPASRFECAVVVLRLERSWLHERINARASSMLSRGLIDEVKDLLEQHGALGRTAAQAVGYREVLKYLHSFEGETSLSDEELLELIRAHTRQFARRQEIWFRGLEELIGIPVERDSTTSQLADQICKEFMQTSQAALIPPESDR